MKLSKNKNNKYWQYKILITHSNKSSYWKVNYIHAKDYDEAKSLISQLAELREWYVSPNWTSRYELFLDNVD